MLLFKNKGEIDVRCINTFGASSKRSESAIGFFGTGLKYAISIMLREHKNITVYSGLKAYEFNVDVVRLQNDDFNVVHMNGEPLSFTTELGKTWELWQAYRELYCNMQDEGGEVTLVDEGAGMVGVAGETRVYVEGIDNMLTAGYILNKKLNPVDSSPYVNVYEGKSNYIYYQGIRVEQLVKPSVFTYDIQHKIDLTEDRTIKYHWDINNILTLHWASSGNPDLIARVLLPTHGIEDLEGKFDFSGAAANSVFTKTVHELHEEMQSPNWSAVKLCMRKEGDNLPQVSTELNNVNTVMLERAIKFSENIGYPVQDYPIIIVKQLGDNVLARASNKSIYIALRTFNVGTKTLAAALIEEYLHLSEGLQDYSLGMQNYLFDALVSMGEQVLGEPL